MRLALISLCNTIGLSLPFGLALGGEATAAKSVGAGAEILKAVGLFGASNLGEGVTFKLAKAKFSRQVSICKANFSPIMD